MRGTGRRWGPEVSTQEDGTLESSRESGKKKRADQEKRV